MCGSPPESLVLPPTAYMSFVARVLYSKGGSRSRIKSPYHIPIYLLLTRSYYSILGRCYWSFRLRWWFVFRCSCYWDRWARIFLVDFPQTLDSPDYYIGNQFGLIKTIHRITLGISERPLPSKRFPRDLHFRMRTICSAIPFSLTKNQNHNHESVFSSNRPPQRQ